jgi:hypothetical protein
VAVQVAVFAATGSFGSPQRFSAGFVAAISVAATLSLMAAIAGVWLPGRRATELAPATANA